MATRKLRIKGSLLNGYQFCKGVADKYGITAQEADEVITFAWRNRRSDPLLNVARMPHRDEDTPVFVEALIKPEDITLTALYAYFDSLEWKPIDPDEENMLVMAGELMRELGPETEATMSRMVESYGNVTRELAILQSTMVQTGSNAADRLPVEVQFGNVFDEQLAMVLRSMAGFTDNEDTLDRPNFVVRLPGEAEITMRRMLLGDSLLLAAMNVVDVEENNMSVWEHVGKELLTRLDIASFNEANVRVGDTFSRQRNPTVKELLPQIIDYSYRYLKAKTIIEGVVASYARTILNARSSQRESEFMDEGSYRFTLNTTGYNITLDNSLSNAVMWELLVRTLVEALNLFCRLPGIGRRIPPFDNYKAEGPQTGYIRWV